MADMRKPVKSRLTEEDKKSVTYWDEMRSSFAPDRDAFLRERAEANRAAAEAQANEAAMQRAQAEKRRRGLK